MATRRIVEPGPAARDLRRFIERVGIGIRDAAEQLDTAHPALLAWLKGICKPDAYRRELIELWTGGTIPRLAWLSDRERAALKRMRPFKRAA